MTRGFLRKAGLVLGITAAAAFSLVPFLLFVSSAFKTQTQVTAIPPTLWPSLSVAFFRSAIVRYGILHYLLNSVIVAGTTTVVTVFLATLAGYALARLPRSWAYFSLLVILACAMFPQIAIVGPVWRFLRSHPIITWQAGSGNR